MKVKNRKLSNLKWVYRKGERKKLPSSYFLLPKERKFPYRNKDGSVNCNMLRAAEVRAKQTNRPGVAARARKLRERYCKG